MAGRTWPAGRSLPMFALSNRKTGVVSLFVHTKTLNIVFQLQRFIQKFLMGWGEILRSKSYTQFLLAKDRVHLPKKNCTN